MAGVAPSTCIFCQIARSSTPPTLLHQDQKVVAFEDINPSAFSNIGPIVYFGLFSQFPVSHMVNVGQMLLKRDAPKARQYRLGFHQPPLLSVNHLHLHCLALPIMPRWRHIKYLPLGPIGGFMDAEKMLNQIKPDPLNPLNYRCKHGST